MLKRSVLLIPLILIIASCASTPLTPKQRTIWAGNVYIAQYDMFLEDVLKSEIPTQQRTVLKNNPEMITQDMIRTNLSEDDRKVLRVKKQILVEVHPILLLCSEYADKGEFPPEDLEREMIRLINKLVEVLE